MAVARGKAQVPVGSSQWIGNEREQVAQFADQEVEDFAFSTRNEVEWLNEHMAEIFNSNQLNVTEIFKTPGKLRGKTPRTARKRNPLEARAPLSDVFSSDVRYNSPLRPAHQSENAAKPTPIKTSTPVFQDIKAVQVTAQQPFKQNVDSGYHGQSEDEMEVDSVQSMQPREEVEATQADSAIDVDTQTTRLSDDGRTTEASFHSAKEDVTRRESIKGQQQLKSPTKDVLISTYPINSSIPPKASVPGEDADAMVVDEDVENKEDNNEAELDVEASSSDASSPGKPLVRKSSLTFASLPAREPLATKKSIGNRVSRTSQLDASKVGPLNRGSYFGRYTGGKSLGVAQQGDSDDDGMDLDEEERARTTRKESAGHGKMAKMHNKSSTQRLHDRINLLGKTQPPRPTKSIPAAVSVAPAAQPQLELEKLVELQNQQAVSTTVLNATQTAEDDDDDWIMPPPSRSETIIRPQLNKSRSVDVMEQIDGKESVGGAQLGMGPGDREVASQKSPLRHSQIAQHPKGEFWYGLKKATSTTELASPSQPMHDQGSRHKKAISVSVPEYSDFTKLESTTPAGSPLKPQGDGHLSASKSKLQSIMKSARGLFTSSAGASAHAKMQLSPRSLKMVMEDERGFGGIAEVMAGPAPSNEDLYPSLPNAVNNNLHESPGKGRKTRSSTEKEEKKREQEARDLQRAEAELQRARDQERLKVLKAKEQLASSSLEATSKPTRQSPRRPATRDGKQPAAPALDTKATQQMAPPARPHANNSLMQKPKEVRRVAKPTKDGPSKAKLPTVSIKVGTMSQRVNNTLSNNLQDSLGPVQEKQVPNKKGSNVSNITSSSTTSYKSASSSVASKPKALIAAERKKEQDEREALRKQENKREIERKRAAALEEAQRREQKLREDAEKQREKEKAIIAAEEAKKVAHKQAVEKRRLEMMKKDQQREQQRTANDLSHALKNEKPQQFGNSTRGDMGTGRPASRMEKLQDFPRPPMAQNSSYNTARAAPIKRVFDPDNEDELSRPTRPQPGQTFQQSDGKRRKTFDLSDEELFGPGPSTTSKYVNAPPIRQSGIRKVPNSTNYSQYPATQKTQEPPKPSSIFHGNYPTAPPPATTHAKGQSLLKTSTTNQTYQQHSYNNKPAHPMDMAKYTSGKIAFADAPNPPGASTKTPMQSNRKGAPTPGSNRSSPMYINGENIHLDDIPTDSEDEDSEDERERKENMPDWVRTPNLFEQLGAQERLNADAVFGPIAPLNMEEVFKDKSRHHKFRSRTSSANWFGADRLTEEEIKQDNAAREKMSKDGGWSYGLS